MFLGENAATTQKVFGVFKAELVRNVWKAWNSISQETIDKYVASGAKRFAECIALKGGGGLH